MGSQRVLASAVGQDLEVNGLGSRGQGYRASLAWAYGIEEQALSVLSQPNTCLSLVKSDTEIRDRPAPGQGDEQTGRLGSVIGEIEVKGPEVKRGVSIPHSRETRSKGYLERRGIVGRRGLRFRCISDKLFRRTSIQTV